VDGQVETHQLNKVLVGGETELVGQVVTVILVLLDWGNLSILVDISVDLGSNGWELGDQVHGVLESVIPVLRLVNTLSICLGESGLVLESSDGKGELGHWVQVRWATVNQLLDEFWNIGSGSPFGRKVSDLLL
jgi:hypothetical protein